MIVETLVISAVLNALGKSDLVKSLGARVATFVAPKFFNKLKSKLKSTTGFDFDKAFNKKLDDLLTESIPDEKSRKATKKKLISVFASMVKSQKFDRDSFMEECAKADLNRDFCESLWDTSYGTLRNIMISVVEGNEALLQKTLLGMSYDIKANTTTIRNTIMYLREDIQTLKEEIIKVLKKDKIILTPTDIILERILPNMPKLFRLSGYIWVDFVAGYVVLRDEKYKELTWLARQGKRLLLIKGQPASGKSTFIRELLWRLYNAGIDAWYIDSRLLKMYPMDRVIDELKEVKKSWIIVDDAFLASEAVKQLIEEVRRTPEKANILVIVTREGLEGPFLPYIEEQVLLKGEEVAEKIILNFARIVNMRLNRSDIDIIKGLSKGNLWILAFALETFYRHKVLNYKMLVKLALETFRREFRTLFSSELEISEAVLLCSVVSIFQSYGINPSYDLILDIFHIDKSTLKQLIDVGILKLVSRSSISLFHDAQAELLHQATANDEALLNDILKKIEPQIPQSYLSLITKSGSVITEEDVVVKLFLVYLTNVSLTERNIDLSILQKRNKPLYDKLNQIITLIDKQITAKPAKLDKREIQEIAHNIIDAYAKSIRDQLIASKRSLIPSESKIEEERPTPRELPKEPEKTTWITSEEEEEKIVIPRVNIPPVYLEATSVGNPEDFVNHIATSLPEMVPIFTEREKLIPILTDLWLRKVHVPIQFNVTTPIYKTIFELKSKIYSNEPIAMEEIPSNILNAEPVIEELTLLGIFTGSHNIIPEQDKLNRINFNRLVRRFLLINADAQNILLMLGTTMSIDLFVKLGLKAFYIENATLRTFLKKFPKEREIYLLAIDSSLKPDKMQKVLTWIRNNIKQKIFRLKLESIFICDLQSFSTILVNLKTIPPDYAIEVFDLALEIMTYKNLLLRKDIIETTLGFISEFEPPDRLRFKLKFIMALARVRPVKLIEKTIDDIISQEDLTGKRSRLLELGRISGYLCNRDILSTLLTEAKTALDKRTLIEEAIIGAFTRI